MAVTFVPTVRLMNPKTGDIIIYNAEDVVKNPRLADGLEVVAHGMGGGGAVVTLDADRFTLGDEKPNTASSDDPKADGRKKRGRPAKGE